MGTDRAGGYGAGAGLSALNLTDEQREKIAKIQEENRSKNWNTMGQVRGEMFKLRQMYFGDKLDSNAISEQQRKVDELRRQMLKSQVETRNQVAAYSLPSSGSSSARSVHGGRLKQRSSVAARRNARAGARTRETSF